MDFSPSLLFGAGFESDPDDEDEEDDGDAEPDEVETEVFGESVAEDVVESGSASLKILASGEFGGRFNKLGQSETLASMLQAEGI